MDEPLPQPDIEPVVDWLADGARPATDPRQCIDMFCERMLVAGVRLDRVAIFVRPLHPHVVARAFYWQRGAEHVEVSDEDYTFLGSEEQLKSPIRVVSTTRREIRVRLDHAASMPEFPILDELRAQGFTDYLITPLEFVFGEVHVLSFATRGAGGFSEAELGALRRVMPALTRIVEIFVLTGKTLNILDAYLGPHAGDRVLNGRIRRGDVETIHAAIWFCDLRGSTSLAEHLGPLPYLAVLNQFFECVLAPVATHGGEILSFIGDAALVIFPAGENVADAATRAVAAAQDAIAAMARLNARRLESGDAELRFGIGLHVGDVLYGNVGTPARITFTVIGSATNEAARIESMCRTIDTTLLVSEDVARLVARPWRTCGSHALRGVAAPFELFTL